jgi:hypothetical protein
MQETGRRFLIIDCYKSPTDVPANIDKQIAPLGSAIIQSLKNYIETMPLEWYTSQTSIDGRPFGTIGLAKMFGVKLPKVKGKPLDELYEAFLAHTESHVAQAEEYRKKQLNSNVDKYTRLFPSFALGEFHSWLKSNPQYQHLAGIFKKVQHFVDTLASEANYGAIDNNILDHIQVDVGGTNYAFRLVNSKRRFIMPTKDEFLRRTAIQAAPEPQENVDSPALKPPVKATPTAPASADDTSTFSRKELLAEVKR